MKISALFESPCLELVKAQTSDQVGNLLYRLTLDRLLVLVPFEDQLEDRCSFGMFFGDIKTSFGGIIKNGKDNMLGKRCGHGDLTWRNEFHLSTGEEPTKIVAYALRLRHTLIKVTGQRSNHRFNTILPESSINWSLPIASGSSTAPPFDIFAIKDLSLSLMKMGMPLSSLYFKLYKLSPQQESNGPSFLLQAARLHNSVGSYHHKINVIIGGMASEIDRLKEAVFNKENERIGALAIGMNCSSSTNLSCQLEASSLFFFFSFSEGTLLFAWLHVSFVYRIDTVICLALDRDVLVTCFS